MPNIKMLVLPPNVEKEQEKGKHDKKRDKKKSNKREGGIVEEKKKRPQYSMVYVHEKYRA